METGSDRSGVTVTRGHRALLLVAAALTYLLVTLGGVVCVTDASRGCPDWPACYGQLLPPPRVDSVLEYAHRVLAALTSISIVASAVLGWRRARSLRWISWPPLFAVGFLVIVIILGAMVVLRGLEPELAALDLGSALMVLALVLVAALVAVVHRRQPTVPIRLAWDSPYARLAAGSLVAVFVVLLSAVLVADEGSLVRCLGWPLVSERWLRGDLRGWLQAARWLLSVVADLLITALVVQAWRAHRRQPAIVRAATAAGVVLLAEILVGLLLPLFGFAVSLLVVYVALAAALWTLLVALVVLTGLSGARPS
jgi:cytochrome c oxidase assembly protein subunit 15